jgi:hypothetical protein
MRKQKILSTAALFLTVMTSASAIKCESRGTDAKISKYVVGACRAVQESIMRDSGAYWSKTDSKELAARRKAAKKLLDTTKIIFNADTGGIYGLYDISLGNYKPTVPDPKRPTEFETFDFLYIGGALSDFRRKIIELAFQNKDERTNDISNIPMFIELYSKKTQESFLISLTSFGQTSGLLYYIDKSGKSYEVGSTRLAYANLYKIKTTDMQGYVYVTAAGLAAKFLKMKVDLPTGSER